LNLNAKLPNSFLKIITSAGDFKNEVEDVLMFKKNFLIILGDLPFGKFLKATEKMTPEVSLI
jgi:hypothetical protein